MGDDKRKYEKVDIALGRLTVLTLASAFITAGVRAVSGESFPPYLFLISLVFLLFGLTCGAAAVRETYAVRIMMRYKNRESYEAIELIGSCLMAVAMGTGCVICFLVFSTRLFAR
jgi:hypothetical protein